MTHRSSLRTQKKKSGFRLKPQKGTHKRGTHFLFSAFRELLEIGQGRTDVRTGPFAVLGQLFLIGYCGRGKNKGMWVWDCPLLTFMNPGLSKWLAHVPDLPMVPSPHCHDPGVGQSAIGPNVRL